jgi:hypothetical protein
LTSSCGEPKFGGIGINLLLTTFVRVVRLALLEKLVAERSQMPDTDNARAFILRPLGKWMVALAATAPKPPGEFGKLDEKTAPTAGHCFK